MAGSVVRWRHIVVATILVPIVCPVQAQELDAALVGRWASDPSQCASESSFARMDVTRTAMSGPSWNCAVNRAVPQDGGWNIGLACSANGTRYTVESLWQVQPNGNLRQTAYGTVMEYLPCRSEVADETPGGGVSSTVKTAHIRASDATRMDPQSRDTIVFVQRRLGELGFDPGEADGRFGTRTSRALRAFEAANGLPETGQIGSSNLAALTTPGSRDGRDPSAIGEASTFDPDTIHGAVRRIIGSYQPATAVYDYQEEAARAAWVSLMRAPPVGIVDVAGLDTEATEAINTKDPYAYISNPIAFTPSIRFLVSSRHKALLAELKNARLSQSGFSKEQAEAFQSRFKLLLGETRGRLGSHHPAVGFILNDMVQLRADVIARFEGGLGLVNTELSALHRDAAMAMLDGWSSAAAGQVVAEQIAMNLISSATRAAEMRERCGEHGSEVFEAYRVAAAIDYAASGPALRQIGWLRGAARCAQGAESAKAVTLARIHHARLTGRGEAQAQVLAELAAAQFSVGDRVGAAASYREAFRIAASYGLAADYETGFLSDEEWTAKERSITPHWQALNDLGLDAELDLYIAQIIQHQIAERSFDSTYGASLVSSFVDVLEGSGRIELADQYYTYLGNTFRGDGMKGVSSPLYMLSLFATQRVDSERYDEALPMLERGLKLAEGLGHKDFILVMTALLARTHTERGALDEGLTFARRGMVLVKQGDVDTAAYDVKEAIGKLDKILSDAEREQKRLDNAVGGLAAELQGKLDAVCDQNGEAWAFPELPFSQVLSDAVTTETFLQHPVVGHYIECFDQRREDFSGPGVQPGDGLGDRISDVAMLLGLLKEKERAVSLLEFVFAKGQDGLGAQASALRGLVRASKGDWFLPYARRATDLAMAKIAEQKKESWFPQPAIAMGLDLLAAGERALSERIYQQIKEDWKGRLDGGGLGCMLADCEYLAVMAEAFDAGDGADAYYASIPHKFTIYHSGAQADTKEANAIRELALNEGRMHLRADRYRLAETYFNLASEIVAGYGPTTKGKTVTEGELEVATAISRIRYERGDRIGAIKIAAPLVAEARERLAERAYSTEAIVRWSHRLRGLFEVYFDSLEAGPDGEISTGENEFFAFQYLQTTRTAATIAKIAERAQTGAGEAVRHHQDLSRALGELYSSFAVASGAGADALFKQIAAKEEEVAAAQREAEASDPSYAARPGFRFFTLSETRARLNEGEAVLLSFVGRHHVYLWLVTQTSNSLRRLAISPVDLDRQVRALRSEATGYNEGIENRRWPLDAFRAPYVSTIGVFGATIDPVKRLYFVPHGLFDGLPLAALLTDNPADEDMTFREMRAARLPWLIRRTAINMLPSLQALEPQVQLTGDVLERRPFLGVGNPDFGAGLRVASVRGLSPIKPLSIPMLPETETEITRIAAILNARPDEDLLVEKRASETVIRQMSLDRYRILTFATHGILAGELRGVNEPALVLAMPTKPRPEDDGLLTASEISTLRLDADLVVLSACNTAGSDGRPGAEGLSGLANAFFYAGARNLVVTHWAIPSNPAVDVSVGMIEAHQGMEQADWAKALQASVLKMMDGDGPVAYVHPGAWGAHMVVGASAF